MRRVAFTRRLAAISLTCSAAVVIAGLYAGTAYADPGPPTLVSAPPIGGVAAVGGTLIAHPGTWEGTSPIAFSYLWYHCPFPVPQPVYISPNWPDCTNVGFGPRHLISPTEAASGSVVVRVFAASAEGTAEAAASAGPIATLPQLPANPISPPVISGVARTGETLEASEGVWRSSLQLGYVFVWSRCLGTGCTDVTGREPTGRYTLTRADVGSQMRVTAVVVQPNGEPLLMDASIESARTTTVLSGAPRVSVEPKVGGLAAVGETLTIGSGRWTGTTPMQIVYQWQSCGSWIDVLSCSNIAGATGPSYRIADVDVRSFLRVRVVAANAVGTTTYFTPLTSPVTAVYTYATARALGYPVTLTPNEYGLPECPHEPPTGYTTGAGAAAAIGSSEDPVCMQDPTGDLYLISRGAPVASSIPPTSSADGIAASPGPPPPCDPESQPWGYLSGIETGTETVQGEDYTGTRGSLEVANPSTFPWAGNSTTVLDEGRGSVECERLMGGFLSVVRVPRGYFNVGWAYSSEVWDTNPHVWTELELKAANNCIGTQLAGCKVKVYKNDPDHDYTLTPGMNYDFQVRQCDSTHVCAYWRRNGGWELLSRTEDHDPQDATAQSMTCFRINDYQKNCQSKALFELHWNTGTGPSPVDGPFPEENGATVDGEGGLAFEGLELRVGENNWRGWQSNETHGTYRRCETNDNTHYNNPANPYFIAIDAEYTKMRVGKNLPNPSNCPIVIREKSR